MGILLIVGGITLYRTFALYEEKQEFNVLKGKVPEFVYGDIELAFTINGEVSTESFPNKGDGYKASHVTCDGGVTADWNNYTWGLENIKSSDNKKIKCSIDFVEATEFADLVKIGDYVSMTPTATTFTISKDLTGFSGNQSINPSELNLWRIISINDDKTIEMISEYVSSKTVHIQGETGYKNFVNVLNMIAAQYANSKYTIATRNIGYNGQTATISAILSQATCGTSNTLDNSKETSGCGDISFQRDANLVRSALGTLKTNKVNATSSVASYWVASRKFGYGTSTYYNWGIYLVSILGEVIPYDIYGFRNDDWVDFVLSSFIRPVFTLRSGLSFPLGEGTNESPWVVTD